MSELICSDDETPSHSIEKANMTVDESVPKKLMPRYETTYDTFVKWQIQQGKKSFAEDVLVAYFHDLAKKYKPTTLWSMYSMLKTTILSKQKINIRNYKQLLAFVKKKNTGYQCKKSKVLTTDQVNKFLTEAPDDLYLDLKVNIVFIL